MKGVEILTFFTGLLLILTITSPFFKPDLMAMLPGKTFTTTSAVPVTETVFQPGVPDMSETFIPQRIWSTGCGEYSSTSAVSMVTVYLLPPRVSRTGKVSRDFTERMATWIFRIPGSPSC